MKKIQKEVKTYENVYVSIDGNEFNNEADCRAWENSYKGTISASYKLLKKIDANASSLGLPGACDDYECYMIKPESLEDIVLINAYIESSTYNKGALTTKHIGEVVILNFGYDHEYCDVYTLSDHFNAITTYASELVSELENNT
jgi:hypothetical protein